MDAKDFTPRPIRFRFWDGERMHYPDGSGLLSDEGVAGVVCGSTPNMYEEWVPLLSTGLTDADGREVFDGDVWRHDDVSLVVQERSFAQRVDRLGLAPHLGRVVGNVFKGIAEPA